MRLWMNSDAFAYLADGDDADMHQVIVGIFQPLRHARVRLRAGQLRRNICVEEKPPAHPRSTGRPADLLRVKSRFIPRSGAKTSTRLFRPAARRRSAADDFGAGVFPSRASRAFSISSSVVLNWPVRIYALTRCTSSGL